MFRPDHRRVAIRHTNSQGTTAPAKPLGRPGAYPAGSPLADVAGVRFDRLCARQPLVALRGPAAARQRVRLLEADGGTVRSGRSRCRLAAGDLQHLL